MSDLDIKYNRMREECKYYKKQEERLRNYVYGYTVSLDCIVPYHKNFFSISENNTFLGVKTFATRIIQYFQCFTGEVSDCFSVDYTADDIKKGEELILLTIYYLQTECPKSDYTFLGIKKILETFLVSIETGTSNNKEDSTFWNMLNKISTEKKDAQPEEIKAAIKHFYENYDCAHITKIADGIFYSVRFFLYDMKMDYMNDPVMRLATLDMIDEVVERLSNIYENRHQRKDWRA